MKRRLLIMMTLAASFLAFSAGDVWGQGVSTSSINGLVTDQQGGILPGANVLAIHEPTGTRYGTISDAGGRYRLPNVLVGGPYRIEITFVGFEMAIVQGIFLNLGDPRKIDVVLKEDSYELQAVEIIASSMSAGESAGASTQISQENIELLPTLNRDLNDFTRLTPQAKIVPGGGLSIAGINNRYNAIYFDGAVNNDVFGLAASGTNGGQTGAPPISIDAIDQIQVVLSPYDVTYGGFAGGGINAVTKSGTNNLEGGAYYYLQNESLAGKTNNVLAERAGADRTRLDEFINRTYGFNLGGALVEDKLFFFVNAEIQREETPLPFEIGDYVGDLGANDFNQLRDFLNTNYNYEAGDFGSKVSGLNAERIFAKFNWNISDIHKLMVRHNYVNIVQDNVFGSNRTNINFANNGIFFPSTTNSTALELNSRFSPNTSNNLIIGFTSVRDARGPQGADFPAVTIDDENGARLRFGSEAFSTANRLDQDVFTITNNFNLYKGNHTITIGTHNEFLSFYNVFIPQNFGDYTYSTLDDFYNNATPAFYQRSYSLVDDIAGPTTAAAADFNAMQLGFYLQDEWEATNRLTLTAGIRLDIPIITTDPDIHPTFNTQTVPAITNAGYDLKGATGGKAPDGQLMISPRVGFNYDLRGDKRTTLRGGVGIFTSRIPFVWPGGMYNNNGITQGTFNIFDVGFPIEFIGDVQNQYTNPDLDIPQGQVHLFTEDFKFPQLFRASLAVDHNFGNGWFAGIEGIYSKTINNVFYENVNSDPTVDFNWTNGAGDNRAVYVRQSIDPRYNAVYLTSNTNEGYTYTITGQVQKRFDFGLNMFAAYTYGDAFALFEGTSSQNASQWRGAMNINGRNFAEFGRSDFSTGHRVLLSADYSIDWGNSRNYRTNISVFYNGESGLPYSYVYGRGARDSRNINNETGSTGRNRSLIYVPANQGDIVLVDILDGGGNVVNSAAQQWAALNQFIEEDEHLSQRRGQYAEKNGARAPFVHLIDFKITQNLTLDIGSKTHTFQLTFDIFNLGNFLNKDWGVVYGFPREGAFEVLNFEGFEADGTTPTFTFTQPDLGNERFNIQNLNSRWRGRLGLRYFFR